MQETSTPSTLFGVAQLPSMQHACVDARRVYNYKGLVERPASLNKAAPPGHQLLCSPLASQGKEYAAWRVDLARLPIRNGKHGRA